MRTLLTLLFILASVALARADVPTVDFGGQRYQLDYEDDTKLPGERPGNGLAEFTLAGETVNDWTKLVAFHVYPNGGDDPALAAAALGKVVKEVNKDASFALLENPKSGDAIIDFLTWAPGSDIMEFNVFKYARAETGPGLVALQFAQRFKLGDLDVEDFRALRTRAVEEMARSDIGQARSYFAAKVKGRIGARGPGEGTTARAGAGQ